MTKKKEIVDEILSSESLDNAYILPLLENSTDFFSVLPENAWVVFDEAKSVWDKFEGLYKEHEERCLRLQAGGEAFAFTKMQYLPKETYHV